MKIRRKEKNPKLRERLLFGLDWREIVTRADRKKRQKSHVLALVLHRKERRKHMVVIKRGKYAIKQPSISSPWFFQN